MKHAALLLSVAMIALAGPAHGQAGKKHDTNAPVDVEADRIEVQDRADRAIFSGNVKVRQQDMTLDSQRLTVAYSGQASSGDNIKIQRMDASGSVVVHNGDQTARGDFAIYDLNKRQITMLGNVRLDQAQNHVQGARLIYDLDNGRAVVDGSAVGGSNIETGRGGRVTGRFVAPDRQNDQNKTPAPTPPPAANPKP
ncbi:MAG: lipopolysaccharide transport periplasmic protein LptA [Sphingomonas sanxanigenens]|uniref:Lipopolysaccharide transport periplasmic protein LptA n=1 Tax=Sphingomonas sanxanigenens TaxID=397260 RepID=A0A2W5A7F3_9SPHN|nr:MAG: lipopolysaccharide transport periplasmic protein LptA [Sphingomonas sanxanigenens]